MYKDYTCVACDKITTSDMHIKSVNHMKIILCVDRDTASSYPSTVTVDISDDFITLQIKDGDRDITFRKEEFMNLVKLLG